MNFRILSVDKPQQIEVVAKLADEIWRDHFVPIIGERQVDYMLKKFLNPDAIEIHIQSGADYYITALDDREVGFMGLVPEPSEHKMMISKFYLDRTVRGLGLGTQMLSFSETLSLNMSIETLWLTVNRFNLGPIEWYQKRGFRIVDEVKKDIGEGYYMDDFIMQKNLCD